MEQTQAAQWRKVDGDVDAETYGATYALDNGSSIEIVKIVPAAEYNKNDQGTYATYADYTYAEIDQLWDKDVRSYVGLDDNYTDQGITIDNYDKASQLIDYGKCCDTEYFKLPFLAVLQRFTGLTADPGF